MLHINRIMPQALTFMVTCLLAVSQALAIDDIGASYQFRHFDKAQGLSNLSVSCILEDRNGFIWVGTTNGLNRFDGVRYKNYFADQNKPGKLPSNVIYALAESRDGSIWVSTYNHLAVYNPEKDTFTTFKPKGVEFTDIVFDLVFDRQGNLWAYDSKNTYCISPKDGTCKTFSTDKYFAPLQINVLTDGQVWITATDGNAYKYNPGANKFTRYPILTEEESEQCQLSCRILEYDNGELLVPTNRKGARLFNPKTGEVRTLFTTAGDNEQIYIHSSLKRQTEDGSEYWFGTEDGIYIYSQKKGWTHHLHKSYSNPTGLTDNAIHHLYTDRNSGIWVGTFFGGVNYLPAAGSTIFRQIMPLNANGTTAANVTRELVSDTEGNLWVGTEDGGLFVLDKNGNGTIVAAQPSCDGKRIPNNIQALCCDGDNLWIGTYEEGIFVMDIHSRNIVRHYAGNGVHGLTENAIVHILKSSSGKMYIGSMYGLFIYDEATDRFSEVKGMDGNFIHYLFEDSQQRIWVSTMNKGLYYIQASPAGGKEELKKADIPDEVFTSVYEDIHGNVYVGTINNGLYVFPHEHPDKGEPVEAVRKPGLGIYMMHEDGLKRLWVTTSEGIICYDREKGYTVRYSENDGIPCEQFNYNSCYADPVGKVYFGSLQGVISFYPQQQAKRSQKQRVYITGFHINGEQEADDHNLFGQSILYAERLELSHQQNAFSIDFAVPEYALPQSVWYRYKMEGADKDWTICQGPQQINYATLSPGSYTFIVQASNEYGVWGDTQEATRLDIIIAPPFYATFWAYMLYTLVVCLIAWYLYCQVRKRRRQQLAIEKTRKENEQYRETLQSKIQFFTTITHEIRTPLTLIMGSLERVEKENGKGDKNQDILLMKRNANRLLDLVNQLLDFRKIESSSFLLNFKQVNLCKLAHELHQNFQPAARQKSLAYQLVASKDDCWVMADEEALTKIITNMLSNATKFAEKQVGMEMVVTEKDGQKRVMLKVSNDGPRIPHEEVDEIFKPFYQFYGTNVNATVKGSGLGLPLARSLAEMQKGSFFYDEKDSTMNTFVLELPVMEEVDTQEDDTDADLAAAEEETGDTTLTEDGKEKPTILIVDDESELRQYVAEELSFHYHVLQAENGRKALAILQKRMVSLVVTDIMMPIMNGMELCRSIKEDVELCHIPIIVLTAKTSFNDHMEALHSKADAYIEKPFSSAQLIAQVENLLANRELVRSVYVNSPFVKVSSVVSNPLDKKMLSDLETCVFEHLTDSEFSVDILAERMNMSKSTLYRKVKSVTSLFPSEFIRICRLKKAAEMMASKEYKIKEVTMMTGFSSVSYFTTCFLKQFGMTPGDFLKKGGELVI